jgi:hypothetical protein
LKCGFYHIDITPATTPTAIHKIMRFRVLTDVFTV